ncbi:MAG: hypothetical protein HFE65_08405 [Clostridiales bacterium]|nr:hypothetical protein [Clostridiales bacterium]
MKNNYFNMQQPKYKISIPGSRIMVIAPHPDDEVIGCGGTILKGLNQQVFDIVYITNGEKGFVSEHAGTAEIRIQEAVNNWNSYNNIHLHFIGLKDSDIICDLDSIRKIGEVILTNQPDCILLPDVTDHNIDHLACNLLIHEALLLFSYTHILIWGYEVWSAINPDIVVNITEYYQGKCQMIHNYISQFQQFDYETLFTLNNKRTAIYGVLFADNTHNVHRVEQKQRMKKNLPFTREWLYAEGFRRYTFSEHAKELSDKLK